VRCVTLFASIALLAQAAEPLPQSVGIAESDGLSGPYCLYVALGSLDIPVGTFTEFQEKLGEPASSGYSLGELAHFAQQQSVNTLGVQTNIGNLRRRPGRFACIAYLAHGHFVLISDVSGNTVKLIDPPKVSNVAPDILTTQWDGTALLLSAEPLLAEEDLPREIAWTWWLAAALALSAGIAAFFYAFRRHSTS
jgi:ABC-type bacteriocin/lantibiotic exporter with double-glycine peptidase domain